MRVETCTACEEPIVMQCMVSSGFCSQVCERAEVEK